MQFGSNTFSVFKKDTIENGVCLGIFINYIFTVMKNDEI